jgi:P4 family phage/plasmid primase-like protien
MQTEEIRQTLKALFDDDDIFEIRIPETDDYKLGVVSGYYDMANIETAIKHFKEFDGTYNIYITLQNIKKDLLARGKNKIKKKAKNTTKDTEVERYRWLLIDLDPIRPKGISSSDKEKNLALLKASEIFECLNEKWNVEPIFADSGNGYHLLYKIDLDNDKEGHNKDLISRTLKGLGEIYTDDNIGVDLGVFNQARITKLYGTYATKGDNTEDRPHRKSGFLRVPGEILTVSREQLEEIATPKEQQQKQTQQTKSNFNNYINNNSFDLDNFISKNGIQVKEIKRDGGVEIHVLKVCPLNEGHKNKSVITKSVDGILGFKCQGGSCSGNGWKTLRRLYDPDYDTKKDEYKISVQQQSQENQEISILEPETIKVPWIKTEYNEKKKSLTHKVLCTELAKHIRQNSNYIFVRNEATESIFRYWYVDGCYKLISDNELKGYIKNFIPEPLQRIADIKEVFELLIYDLKFVSMDELNNDENIINFENGLLHLDTMELKPHTPSLYSTIQIPCNYNPESIPSDQKHFDKFINHLTSNDQEVKSLLLQFMGVGLSNIQGWRMKKSLFLVGEGNVGKSQLNLLMHKLLGRHNCSSVDLEMLEARFGTSRIFNKRLSGSSDMKYMGIKELSVFKKATGGDPLETEFKGKTSFEFSYKGLFWFCCNRLPKFGGDKGEWVYDRIMVCECNNPVLKKDKFLLDKMYSEREYIVALAIQELRKVIHNEFNFIIPGAVKKATEQYKIDNDSFLTFLAECTVERPNGTIQDSCSKPMVFKVYKEWCKDNNNGFFEKHQEIKETLERIGKGNVKKVDGNIYYTDFTLSLETKKEYQYIYGNDMRTK